MLAEKLHLSVQRCKAETTSAEFTTWMNYIKRQNEQEYEDKKRQLNTREKWEHYAASMLSQLIRSVVAKPGSVPDQTFLRFDLNKPETPEEIKRRKWERAMQQKKFWLASFGLKDEG
jgi:hypothetical protein